MTFNNRLYNKNADPLVEAAKSAMELGQLRRDAIAAVNEEFGVYSRNAVVREHLAAYDARVEEAYKCMKEGKPNDGNLANNYPPYDKVTRGDVIAGRLGKDQMGGKKKVLEKKTWEETDYSAPDRAAVTKDNNPVVSSTAPKADTSGPSAADKAGLASKIKTMNEVSKGSAIRSYAASQDYDNEHPKGEKIHAHIVRKFGKEAGEHAERHADASNFGRPNKNRGASDSLPKTAPSSRMKTTKSGTFNKQQTKSLAGDIKRRLGSHTKANLPEGYELDEARAVRKDITKGGVTAPLDYSEPRHPNPGAITSPSPVVQPIKEAWKRLKEAKKEMKEARKCMGEEFDSFDFSEINEAFANYIAEAINKYGLKEEHPEATVENLHMFNEAYVAAVLGEAEKCEYEKASKHDVDSKKHKKHMKMAKELKEARKYAKKESDEKELDEAKKWIQSAIKRPGALSKKLGVPEEKNIPASKLKVKEDDTPQTKKQKVLAKTLKHLARKKKMHEETLEERGPSHYLTHFNVKDGEVSMGKVTTKKGLADPGEIDNISRREAGAIQSIRPNKVTGKREIVTPNAGPSAKDEKSTQSFLNKELGRTTANPQGPEAPSTTKSVPTPPSRPTFSSDLPRIDTGPKPGPASTPQSAAADAAKSSAPDVPTPPSRPADLGPKMQNPDQNITKVVKESVQVGDNKYRIV